jgi:uncharacterized protein with ParB-like and HNH nuclease domain
MIEDNDLDEVDDYIDDETEEFRYSITSYGVDYTVDRLVDRLSKNNIVIPEFQRQYVWNIKEASRFVESLILGLPVPGIFFAQDKDTGQMLVIDGQQRLISLKKFYDERFGDQVFKLKDVQSDLVGKTIGDLTSSDRLKLDDSVIHATVIKQDAPDDDDSSIYMIFERLNTGGKKLVPQEIRACIYHGSFNQMLNKLSNDHIWKEIYSADNKRLKSEELILRFFALRDEWNEYTKGLKSFLNRYMEKNRNIDDETQEKYSEIFCKSIRFVYDTIGPTAFRIGKNLNAAIFDSVLVATSYLLDVKDSPETSVFKDGYEQLLKDTEYRKYVESSTSSELSIKKRISLAKKFLCENG